MRFLATSVQVLLVVGVIAVVVPVAGVVMAACMAQEGAPHMSLDEY